MNKILVIGFPHSGTTILRKLIGNSSNVYDVSRESFLTPNIDVKEDNIVIKLPHMNGVPDNFYMRSHIDYKIVMLIKNPYDVFGSLTKRYDTSIPKRYNLNTWIKYSKYFYNLKKNIPSNIFMLRYEDMFENNYKKIKEIFKFLNLLYSEEEIIFNNRDCFIVDNNIPKKRPLPTEHGAFRTWQINQKFENRVGDSCKALPDNIKIEIDKILLGKELMYAGEKINNFMCVR